MGYNIAQKMNLHLPFSVRFSHPIIKLARDSICVINLPDWPQPRSRLIHQVLKVNHGLNDKLSPALVDWQTLSLPGQDIDRHTQMFSGTKLRETDFVTQIPASQY